ncbi:unnamed protein product [Haemonchus placei]|uniref:PH domain-containing protein n=1 Tax=Haemonchus placei TaxID=6290 RepID=A0A0N4WGN1_HAEPC|nr:unnamed protein product [Haemonchus placei]
MSGRPKLFWRRMRGFEWQENEKDVAETYAKIGDCLERMARVEPDKLLARTEVRASDGMHKLKKVEARSANDEELKLTDTLTYFTRDTQAAKV